MTTNARDQAYNIVPARAAAVWSQIVDTTSRVYDFSALSLGGSTRGWMIVTIEADGADVFYAFGSVTHAIDETAGGAASSATVSAFTASGCARIPSGTSKDVRIQRDVDKFLALKGSATGKARIYASSERSGGA